MLDELLERQEYELTIEKNNSNQRFRLLYATLGNQLSGLYRALNIIAREQLFKGETPNISATREFLLEWLKKLPGSDSLNSILVDSKKSVYKAKAPDILNYLQFLQERCTDSMYKNITSRKNDINKITLDQIIASSLDDGPLRRYALVAKDDLFAKKAIYKKDPRLKETKIAPVNQEYLLKATAAFLLQNKLNQLLVAVTDADTINWCSTSVRNVSFFFTDTHKVVFEKVPVFLSNNNTIKYHFHKNWIENFALIEIADDDSIQEWGKLHPDWKYYYLDKGSSASLEQHQF